MTKKITKQDAEAAEKKLMDEMLKNMHNSQSVENRSQDLSNPSNSADSLSEFIEVNIENTYKHPLNTFPERTGDKYQELYENVKARGKLSNDPVATEEDGKYFITKGWNRRNVWKDLGNKTIRLKLEEQNLSDYDIAADLFSDNNQAKTLEPHEDFQLFLNAKSLITEQHGYNSRGEINGGLYNHLLSFGYNVNKSKRYIRIHDHLSPSWTTEFLVGNLTQRTSLSILEIEKPIQELLYKISTERNISITTALIKKISNSINSNRETSEEDLLDIILDRKPQTSWMHSKKSVKLPILNDTQQEILNQHFSNKTFEETFEILLSTFADNLN